MRKSKFGLRALGLSLVAVLGLMAFMAVGAQAETLKGTTVAGLIQIEKSSALVPGATATGAQEGAGKLLVPGRSLSLECTSGDVKEGNLISDTEGLARILFLGCRALNLAKESEEIAGCTVSNGKTIEAVAKLIARKHEGKPYVLAEPDSPATSFTTVEFEAGKGCALPLKNVITGSVVAEATVGEVVKQLITFNKAITELFQVKNGSVIEGDRLLFGTFESFIDASATVELNDEAHKGRVFGIV